MSKANPLSLLKTYFKSFAQKDIDELKNLFSDDIELIDWNNTYKGKDKVLNEVEGIFSSFTIIRLYVINIFSELDIVHDDDSETDITIPKNNSYACQIEIIFDDTSPLHIMDLIEFDDDFKIKKINAYNRNFGK